MALTRESLSQRWDRQWPGVRPVAYELRSALPDRWVRFHSLPDSKRYAETADDYDEILRRHLTVLAELSGGTSAEVTVICASWSETATSDLPPPDIGLASEPWRTVALDEGDPESGWLHLHLASTKASSPEIRSILLKVADDQLHDVMVLDDSVGWIYHPYDGGADVVAASADERDRLKRAHSAWLSALPSGL